MNTNTITVLGKTFNSDEERRTYFREELRKKLPELKNMEGFPIGEDNDIINLSDPPFYTACPNPWLNDFIAEWEKEKIELEKEGLRQTDFEVNEPYANDISEGKNNPIYSVHSYHTKVPHPAIMRYLLHYTQPGDVVFDGFAGTGMTGVAAKQCGNGTAQLKYRLGSEYKLAHDKEPNWGERNAIVSDLAPAATFIAANLNSHYKTNEVKRSLTKKLNDIYSKYKWMYETKHTDGSIGRINFTVWSEVTSCPECSAEFTLWEVSADTINGRMKKEFNCTQCNVQLTKKECNDLLLSSYDSILNTVIKSKKYEPVLVNYSIGKKRYFKDVDKHILETISRIEKIDFNNYIPVARMPVGDESRRNDKYGITHIHHFYTKRNLIFISELWSNLTLQEKFIATSVISRNLTKLNRFIVNKHNPNGRINGPLSGTLYVSSEYVEQNPFDLLKSKIPKFEWNNKGVVTSTNPAQHNSIADNAIDYIFTDPPFGANLMYSELNFIWEAWLGVFTDNKPEAIENSSQNKSTLEYQQLMLACFKDYYRILKPGKWMTVEFSNTSAAVWNGIQTALTNAGFIVANVSALDKKHGGIKSMAYTTAVKQDLIISCYKPSSTFDEKFKQNNQSAVAIWDFVEEHLQHLPVHLEKDNSTTAIIERSPKILFDRLIAFYIQRSLPVPIDAGNFQKGLRERFIERDGMFFTQEQVAEYDVKKQTAPNFVQLSILVASEQDGVMWLHNLLEKKSLAYQDIQPQWMQALAGVRKGDRIPELMTILEENFLKDEVGKWYVPDVENIIDLEKLRTKRLLKEFDVYKEQALKPKGKLTEVRVEALRAGFKYCYQQNDFKMIIAIGDKIPNDLLMEDEILLQYYDIATYKV